MFSGKSQKKRSGSKYRPQEEHPSFFDELDFEEEPVQPKKIGTLNLYQQFLQS
jgi:hypothetical protein